MKIRAALDRDTQGNTLHGGGGRRVKIHEALDRDAQGITLHGGGAVA